MYISPAVAVPNFSQNLVDHLSNSKHSKYWNQSSLWSSRSCGWCCCAGLACGGGQKVPELESPNIAEPSWFFFVRYWTLFHSILDKMEDDGNAFDGVAFHCYAGSVLNQDAFHNAFPSTVNYLQILHKNTVFLNKCSLYTWQNALEHMAVIGGKI